MKKLDKDKKMKEKRGLKDLLKNNFLSLVFVIVLICLGAVVAGNVIIKEGDIGAEGEAQSLNFNTNGSEVRIGEEVGFSNDLSNILIGKYISKNITGTHNIIIGKEAGRDLTSGIRNLLIGRKAGLNLENGDYNTLIGYQTGIYLVSGARNFFMGFKAGEEAIGNYNVFLGEYAGRYAGNTNNSIFIGKSAGYSETDQYKLVIDGKGDNPGLIEGDFNDDYVIINGDLNVTGNTHVQNLTVWGTFADLTPAWGESSKNALDAIIDIKNKDGEIDHSSYPKFAQAQIPMYISIRTGEECEIDEEGEEICVEIYEKQVDHYLEGRNIGATVTLLIESVKALHEENQVLKDELCLKDSSYSWC